jgi:hypothetical protein
MYNVQVKSRIWLRNLSAVNENITSHLVDTRTLMARQHCYFNIQSAAAEELVVRTLMARQHCCFNIQSAAAEELVVQQM